MNLTSEQLAAAWTCAPTVADKWLVPLNEAMSIYEIDTPQRVAAFLAQTGHESGSGKWVREIWGPTGAQLGYEGRADLGNTEVGDGFRFLGRGLIQITGRANYRSLSDAIGYDFVADPRALEQPKWAATSAAWFWNSRGLNELADAGDIAHITRKINGGFNGLIDRETRYAKAMETLA